MSDRLSGLSGVLHRNVRSRVTSQITETTLTSRPGIGRAPATTLPQAIQMTRNVQSSLDWVLSKQVS